MAPRNKPKIWNTFSVVEYKPQKFVTKIDDEIVRKSTEADLMFYSILKKSELIDGDDIQITIAVGALSAIIVTSGAMPFVRVISVLC